jgi:hypothetical protein
MSLLLTFRVTTLKLHSKTFSSLRTTISPTIRNMSANTNNTPHADIIDAIKQSNVLPTMNPGAVLSNRYEQEQIPDLSGRTAVVLGGSAGIGGAVTAALAVANARVIIVSTTQEHAERTIDSANEKMREARSKGYARCMFLLCS